MPLLDRANQMVVRDLKAIKSSGRDWSPPSPSAGRKR
jgi:hypothetical protein